MTAAEATEKGYKLIVASRLEFGLVKHGQGIRTWWQRDFRDSDGVDVCPTFEHPLVQEAIEITERMAAPAATLPLRGGTEITHEQAVTALDEAMTIIEAVGTTGIHSRVQAAGAWMKRYYPNWS